MIAILYKTRLQLELFCYFFLILKPMQVQISESTRELLGNNKRYNIVERGKMNFTNKGEIKTFFVTLNE